MRFSLSWLREFIELDIAEKDLVETLAMRGFESQIFPAVVEPFTDIRFAKIIAINNLSNAQQHYLLDLGDKTVNVLGNYNKLLLGDIVAFAAVNNVLLGETITTESFDNITADGIICTEQQLGLDNNLEPLVINAIVELGEDVYTALQLDDQVLEFDITPNRGDCLSVAGFVTELSAIFQKPATDIAPVFHLPEQHIDYQPVKIHDSNTSPNFITRIIYDVDNQAQLPLDILTKLYKCQIKSINPVVDILNYVMLELGQPMHAYDFNSLEGDLVIDFASANEEITLLNSNKVQLTSDTLVVRDDNGVVAIAGVMGSERSAISKNTQAIVLESAYFNAKYINGCARKYGLTTDASFRFERGVCPTLTKYAIDRAAVLIAQYCGGKIGPVNEVIDLSVLPQSKLIKFRPEHCNDILGFEIPLPIMRDVFQRLGFAIREYDFVWEVRVPANRFDLHEEIDLTEEVIRLYGYNKVESPENSIQHTYQPQYQKNPQLKFIRNSLVASGYNEAITYSFVDPTLQTTIFSDNNCLNIVNPIASNLSQMRTSLLPGLIQAFQHNQKRQHDSVRLFEIGQCFAMHEQQYTYTTKVAGLLFGRAMPEQWAVDNRTVDFFDLKHAVEVLLAQFMELVNYQFLPVINSFLHPRQAATILHDQQELGFIGKLHPQLMAQLGIKHEVFVFELDINKLPPLVLPQYQNLSKYPAIRRDLSFFVKKEVTLSEITKVITQINCHFLKKLSIFDVYENKNRPLERSVAIGLLLQSVEKTLVDNEVEEFITQVVATLQQHFNIELRNDAL